MNAAAASARSTGQTAGTKGFLFSDLRGYTAFVEDRGDRAAAELLARYRDLVREVIAAHVGAEVKTEGDSFYVVFPNASAAVEAGLAIVAAAAARSTGDRPLRVGVGVHAGETVETTEGLVGGAVNIAARVCAKAQAGEVLVTDTVRALTRTFLPYRYTSLGRQQLKGVAGGVPLYRVEAAPSTRSARIRRQVAARRRAIAGIAALAAIVILAGAAASVFLRSRPPDCLTLPETTADVVARIDPVRDCVIATYPVGRRPTRVVSAGSHIWVLSSADATVTALATNGSPYATVGIPTIGEIGAPGQVEQFASGMAADDTSLWVLAPGGITRIGLEQASLVSTYGIPAVQDIVAPDLLAKVGALTELNPDPGPAAIATTPGRVWVSLGGWPWVLPFDTGAPGTEFSFQDAAPPEFGLRKEAVLTFVPELVSPSEEDFVFDGPGLLAVVGRDIWVAHAHVPEIAVVDPASRAIVKYEPLLAAGHATALVSSENELWIGYSEGQVAHGSDARPDAAETAVVIAEAITSLALGSSGLWATSGPAHSVYHLDARSLAIGSTVALGGRPEGVAVAPDGSVWVAIR